MSADFAAARLNMVESQVRPSDVTDHALQDAIRVVARESLLPAAKAFAAYADAEVEYAPGRWLMRPRDVTKLLQALGPRAGERALAIAAPYAAAVLDAMGVKVTRLDEGDLSVAPAGAFDLIISEGPSRARRRAGNRPGGRRPARRRRAQRTDGQGVRPCPRR